MRKRCATRCPVEVNRVVLSLRRLLPVCPDKQTSRTETGTSEKCQKISIAPQHRRCPTSRDFVPWRFLDAGRHSAWKGSLCRRPKTCTIGDLTDNFNRALQCANLTPNVLGGARGSRAPSGYGPVHRHGGLHDLFRTVWRGGGLYPDAQPFQADG